MKNIVEINNLTFNYQTKKIFNNLNLEIKSNTFTTLLGPNGTGKSTLVKILLGLKEFEGTIKIDNIELNQKNLKKIRKTIGVIFEDPNTNLVCETVKEELEFTLKNNNYKKEEIEKKVTEVTKQLKIEKILDEQISHLSGGEKQLVALAAILVLKPKIIILDEAFTMLDGISKEKILKILKKLNKDEKITIINITHDSDDSLFGTDVAILYKSEIILNEKVEKAIQEEKKFKKAKLGLPFMAELSLKLKYYGLTEKIIINMDTMVDKIWK